MVLVKNLYIVFARAIGLGFVSIDGLDVLYRKIVRLVFHEVGIYCYLYIVEIREIIDHGIDLACFLIWNLGCYLVQGLCYLLGI